MTTQDIARTEGTGPAYLLINRTGLFTRRVTLEEAARETGIDAEQIEWACEEYGRCDTKAPTGAELTVIADEWPVR